MFALIETENGVENGVRPAILEATGQYRGAPVGGKPTSEKKDRGQEKKDRGHACDLRFLLNLQSHARSTLFEVSKSLT